MVCLTGFMGSGKSTVAARFAALGATVVDTDEISRALTGAQGAALEELRQAFDDFRAGRMGAIPAAR